MLLLSHRQSLDWVDEIGHISSAHSHQNIFNVSIAKHGNWRHVAFRGLPPGAQKPFHAFYARQNPDNTSPWSVVDLSTINMSHGIAPTADPKLFTLNDGLYVTFNTGYTSQGTNQIYIQKVYPDILPPQLVIRDDERNRIEKNWSFYQRPGEPVSGVYSLSPLTELVHVSGMPGSSDDIHFRGVTRSTSVDDNLTMGTPLSFIDDTALLIAHQKLTFQGKRAYVGRAVKLSALGTREASLIVSRKRIAHSVTALLPQRSPHNPNLFSATYFSGLISGPDTVTLGYGINDLKFGIACIEERELWK